MTSEQSDSADAFDELGAFEVQRYVVAELNEERSRRVRIDAQGSSLITGSTALSALAFAATTLVSTSKTFELPRLSLWALGITFAAFMVAAFCGLRGGGKIHNNETVDIDKLEAWRGSDEVWLGSRTAASREHLGHLIAYLRKIRCFNDDRARWVIRGSLFQIVALFGLSAAVAIILIAAMYPGQAGWYHWLEPPSHR